MSADRLLENLLASWVEVQPLAALEPSAGPVGVFLPDGTDPWCRTRLGVWWPTLNLWVDRLVLHPGDAAPDACRTYPLVPPAGMEWRAVHGQVVEGMTHVLVTGADGDVVTQASGMCDGQWDPENLVLATLVAAVGLSEDSDVPGLRDLSDDTLARVSGGPWNTPGWTIPADELPAKVLRALGRYETVAA